MRIGNLAQLTNVSVRMLRHYDEIGLFKPELVRDNGYREYSVSQLPLLNRILALKDLGFSLEQITELVQNGFSGERLRELLHLKRAQLESHIAEERARLERVEARLRMIEQENIMPSYDVKVKSLPAQLVASVRDPSLDRRISETERDIGGYYEVLLEFLAKRGLSRNTVQINLWYDLETLDPLRTNFPEVEVAQVIPHPVPPSEHVRIYELGGVPHAACLEFRGPHEYPFFEPPMTGLFRWIEQHEYRVCGPVRQVYLEPITQTNPNCVIEWQVPIQRD